MYTCVHTRAPNTRYTPQPRAIKIQFGTSWFTERDSESLNRINFTIQHFPNNILSSVTSGTTLRGWEFPQFVCTYQFQKIYI